MIRIIRKEVMIVQMPLSLPADDLPAMFNDAELIDAIMKEAKELTDEGIEVFAKKNNCIATEQGYYCAYFKDFVHPILDKITNEQ